MIYKYNYGKYSSSNYGAHTICINIGNLEVWFSYDTPVAFRAPGFGMVKLRNSWGPTTGKHLRWIPQSPPWVPSNLRWTPSNVKEQVPQEEFDQALSQAYAQAIVEEASQYRDEFIQKFHEIIKKRIKEAA